MRELEYLPPFFTLTLVAVTTAFSRFEIHSVCYNVLQLHQFQLDRVYAAESTGRNLVGDEQEGEERRPRAEVGTAGVVSRG